MRHGVVWGIVFFLAKDHSAARKAGLATFVTTLMMGSRALTEAPLSPSWGNSGLSPMSHQEPSMIAPGRCVIASNLFTNADAPRLRTA